MGQHLVEYARSERGREAARRLGGHNRTHGMTKTPTYDSWRGMKDRCGNPNHRDYPRYGGRGITVDERWSGRHGFAAFYADMGERPEGHTLDRIDNDGPYAPGNCRWADASTQRLNHPQPRGWKRAFRAQTPGRPKTIRCQTCDATGEVSSRVSRWYCDPCRAAARRATQARHEARGTGAPCAFAGCDRAAVSKGYCRKDYQRLFIKRSHRR